MEDDIGLEDYLVELGIDGNVIDQAKLLNKNTGMGLLKCLNQMGSLDDEKLVNLYQVACCLPLLDDPLLDTEIQQDKFSVEFLRSSQMLPMVKADGSVDVAFANPMDRDARQAAKFVLQGRLGKEFIVRPSDWKKAFTSMFDDNESYSLDSDVLKNEWLEQVLDSDRDAPVVRKIASYLGDAVIQGASDVHIEPKRNSVDIRFRIDGKLELKAQEQAGVAEALIARVKVIADLDLGERHLPQDGRTTIVVQGKPIDIRVSIVPAAAGESAVLRLLDRPSNLLTLAGLGFDQKDQKLLQQVVLAKDGLFLVAGPTGSGKTTSLYACLQLLNGSKLKIVSVEDPIEYQFDHVTQVQASSKGGLTFPTVLRSFLRHDPDVILVGEIRDVETAKIAVQAALTGHLVLASIHAIDADRIVTRLTDMGIDEYQLQAALRHAMSQRLVRKLCERCAVSYKPDDHELEYFMQQKLDLPVELFNSVGCNHCNSQGFKGRLVIAEFLGDDHRTLMNDALQKVAMGKTTLKEILSVMGE